MNIESLSDPKPSDPKTSDSKPSPAVQIGLCSMAEHYFTAEPVTPEARKRITVSLADRELDVHTAAGIFSPAGVDKGTQILLDEAPTPPARGTMLDIGCGWGPITLTLALRSPQADVWGVDVNERAMDLARLNASDAGAQNVTVCSPEDVPADVGFDLIWSNPPIRVGKQVLHEILMTWLPRLNPGGEAYLVVQKNLGSDSLQKWLAANLPADWTVDRYARKKEFRILRVARPA